jgi:multidrug efflux system outer membrane protein
VFSVLLVALAVSSPDGGIVASVTYAPGLNDGGVTYSLETLIERSRTADGRVREAEADLRIMRGKYEEARWAWFPKLEATVFVAGPTPEARNNGLGGPPTTQASYMYDLNIGTPGVMLGADVEGVLPIYTFGKLSALEDLAANVVNAGKSLRDRAQAQAETDAAQAYWGYQFARGGKTQLLETMKQLEDAQTTLKRLREEKSEQVTQMDIYKLDFYRRQVEARVSLSDTGANLALAAVRLLTATPPNVAVHLTAQEIPEPHVSLDTIDEYLQLAAEYRPELRAINSGLVARQKDVFIHERMFLPDFGIAAFGRWKWTTSATRQISPFAYDPYNELTAGLALVGRYTFDIPQKMAQLEQSRGELEKMQRQKELLAAAVRLEIEKAHGELSDALARARTQAEAERSSRRWATSAFAAFDLGTTDTRELVDSLTALGVASGERLHAWYDVQVGYRTLARAVGTTTIIPAFGSRPAPE